MIQDPEAQFTLATVLITLLSAFSIAAFLTQRRYLLVLAGALVCAWAGGYEWATHTQLMFFTPNDDAQVNYSGIFVGDGSLPASTALWLRYVATSMATACLIVAFGGPRALPLALGMGCIVLPAIYAWSHVPDGWLTLAGLADSAGGSFVFVPAGIALFAHAAYTTRSCPPPQETPSPRTHSLRLIVGIGALMLAHTVQQSRAIDAVWLSLATAHMICAATAGGITACILARYWTSPPRLSPWHGMLAGIMGIACDPLSFSLPQAAGAGALACIVASAVAWAMRRYDPPCAAGIGVLAGSSTFGALAVCVVNPLAAIQVQAFAIAATASLSIAATLLMCSGLRLLRARLPQWMR